MLESALGTDLGLIADFVGFGLTALYRYHIVSPAGFSFNYGDNGQDYMSAEPHYTWLALRFGHRACEVHSRELLEAKIDKVRPHFPPALTLPPYTPPLCEILPLNPIISPTPTYCAPQAELKGPKKQNKFDRCMALHALWFPQAGASSGGGNSSSSSNSGGGGGGGGGGGSSNSSAQCTPATVKPLDVRFRGNGEIAILCSNWSDPNALYVGLKVGCPLLSLVSLYIERLVFAAGILRAGVAFSDDTGCSYATAHCLRIHPSFFLFCQGGKNGCTHGHLDLGSFVLDALGERWSMDFGGDDYALPGYASKVCDHKSH